MGAMAVSRNPMPRSITVAASARLKPTERAHLWVRVSDTIPPMARLRPKPADSSPDHRARATPIPNRKASIYSAAPSQTLDRRLRALSKAPQSAPARLQHNRGRGRSHDQRSDGFVRQSQPGPAPPPRHGRQADIPIFAPDSRDLSNRPEKQHIRPVEFLAFLTVNHAESRRAAAPIFPVQAGIDQDTSPGTALIAACLRQRAEASKRLHDELSCSVSRRFAGHVAGSSWLCHVGVGFRHHPPQKNATPHRLVAHNARASSLGQIRQRVALTARGFPSWPPIHRQIRPEARGVMRPPSAPAPRATVTSRPAIASALAAGQSRQGGGTPGGPRHEQSASFLRAPGNLCANASPEAAPKR